MFDDLTPVILPPRMTPALLTDLLSRAGLTPWDDVWTIVWQAFGSLVFPVGDVVRLKRSGEFPSSLIWRERQFTEAISLSTPTPRMALRDFTPGFVQPTDAEAFEDVLERLSVRAILPDASGAGVTDEAFVEAVRRKAVTALRAIATATEIDDEARKAALCFHGRAVNWRRAPVVESFHGWPSSGLPLLDIEGERFTLDGAPLQHTVEDTKRGTRTRGIDLGNVQHRVLKVAVGGGFVTAKEAGVTKSSLSRCRQCLPADLAILGTPLFLTAERPVRISDRARPHIMPVDGATPR